MKRQEFDELFDKFASNNWAFLKRDGLPETRKLYYHYFKEADYAILKRAFENLVKSQKLMPSVATIRGEIDIVKFEQPQPKVVIPSFNKKRSDRIKQMITETRKIIDTITGAEKMAKLKECSESFLRDRAVA